MHRLRKKEKKNCFAFKNRCTNTFIFFASVDSYPYQLLPNREGYIPVYIRMGDTPLNDINPELAVAFHEVAVNGRQLKSNDEVSHKL